MNITQCHLFDSIYQPSFSKLFGISVSVFNILVCSPLMYYVVWHEKYGSDVYRTLQNKLMASIIRLCVCYTIVGQSFEVIISSFGPFDTSICAFQIFLKNFVVIVALKLLLSVTIVKHNSIFVLKNPTSLDSDFWCRFINISVLLQTLVFQIVFHRLPGKYHISFYVCSALDPRPIWEEPFKKNHDTVITFCLTIVCYAFNLIRIRLFKKKFPIQTISNSLDNNHLGRVPINQLLDIHSLADSATIFVSLLFYPIVAYVVIGLNVLMSPEELGQYPNYILFHFFSHEMVFLWNVYVLLILFGRSDTMRRAFLREVKQMHETFVSKFD